MRSFVLVLIPDGLPPDALTHGVIEADGLTLMARFTLVACGNCPPLMPWHKDARVYEGSGEIITYDGKELAKKGLVVVTINYRLGTSGFTHILN